MLLRCGDPVYIEWPVDEKMVTWYEKVPVETSVNTKAWQHFLEWSKEHQVVIKSIEMAGRYDCT